MPLAREYSFQHTQNTLRLSIVRQVTTLNQVAISYQEYGTTNLCSYLVKATISGTAVTFSTSTTFGQVQRLLLYVQFPLQAIQETDLIYDDSQNFVVASSAQLLPAGESNVIC